MTSKLLDRYREKLNVSYVLAGIQADVAQLLRAYLQGNSKGKKKNINQIIKKLEKINKQLQF